MVPDQPATTPPEALPMLSQGKHRNPARGACFMEYTSVLAGESFTDSPRCVDAELAAVLRGANDMLSDEERPAMVPLLGRAIGLVVPSPRNPAGRVGFRLRRRRSEHEDPSVARTAELRREVSERFRRALGVTTAHPRSSWYARHARVSRLFWDLMNEPAPPETSDAYAERLVGRLSLLHDCYEQAMAALALPRATTTAGTTAATPAERLPRRAGAEEEVRSAGT